MPDVGISQVIIVVVFLALLLALQFVVKKNKAGLGAHIQKGRRLKVIDSLNLGDGARLLMVDVEGQKMLFGTHKSSAPQLYPLPEIEPAPKAEAAS